MRENKLFSRHCVVNGACSPCVVHDIYSVVAKLSYNIPGLPSYIVI
jgi:hypothetical protein